VPPTPLGRLALRTGDGGFGIPRAPVLAVVVAAGLAMVYMGTRQLRDPARAAGESARYRARRDGIDVEDADQEPLPAAVERARKGGYVLLGLGIAFLLLAATQVV
jgi:hypothetical protein